MSVLGDGNISDKFGEGIFQGFQTCEDSELRPFQYGKHIVHMWLLTSRITFVLSFGILAATNFQAFIHFIVSCQEDMNNVWTRLHYSEKKLQTCKASLDVTVALNSSCCSVVRGK